jgi:hypothetical protein
MTQAGGMVCRFRASFMVKYPTLADRLWFVWDHRRRLTFRIAVAIVWRRATGYSVATYGGWGTFYCNHGYRERRRRTR